MELPPEETSGDVNASYFQIERPGAMGQTPEKAQVRQEGFSECTKSEHWSAALFRQAKPPITAGHIVSLVLLAGCWGLGIL